jgi:AraC-like DNA-binding protein
MVGAASLPLSGSLLGIPIVGRLRSLASAMPHSAQEEDVRLGDHRFGRVNRRMPIGPVRWPFFDLFWVHEGGARIAFTEQNATLDLIAPDGLLILPGTLFQGATSGAFATASICHFELAGNHDGPGWLVPRSGEALHIQNMLKLSMELARRDRPAELPRRKRLLLTLLDSFAAASAATAETGGRLATAWQQARQNLHRMRTLSDVAALLGISESAFRAMHREAWHTSAGEHLRELRLTRAEELIVGTDKTLAEIAEAVGYRHAATLSAAFRERRGKTPGEYRRWSNPFA